MSEPKVLFDHKTEWTLNLGRDYVDATVFGDSKTYLTKAHSLSGTLHGALDWMPDLNDTPQMLFMYGPMPMPWWRRWAYIVLARWLEWPQVLIASGPAKISYSQKIAPDENTINGNFTADGMWMTNIYVHPPMRRWIWDRLRRKP